MWNYTDAHKYTVPKGTYYVGDLCYALDTDIYHTVFGGQGYRDGFYHNGKDFFLVAGTAFGDGQYVDTLGRVYSVDSGTLGICPMALAENRTEGGQVIVFNEDVTCEFYRGMFSFTPFLGDEALFVIDTYGDDSEFSE